MSSQRRRSSQVSRSRANHATAVTTTQLSVVVAALQDTIHELKSDVLALTRKVISLEAELDHIQEKRQL